MANLKLKEEIREFDIPMSFEEHIDEFRKRITYILMDATITFCTGGKARKGVRMGKVRYAWAVLVQ